MARYTLTPAPQRPDLDKLLETALARGPMMPEELFEQKVSFVYGQMMDCAPDITKEQIRERLREEVEPREVFDLVDRLVQSGALVRMPRSAMQPRWWRLARAGIIVGLAVACWWAVFAFVWWARG